RIIPPHRNLRRPLFQCEPQFERHLEMANGAIDHMAPGFDNLEPVDAPDRLRGACDRIPDRVVDTNFRRTDQLNDLIDMVAHFRILLDATGTYKQPTGDAHAAYDASAAWLLVSAKAATSPGRRSILSTSLAWTSSAKIIWRQYSSRTTE